MDKERTVKVTVVDKEGDFLGDDITRFSELLKRCAIVATTIRTGKHYYIKEDDSK